jgi:HEAT repeat protein
MNESLALHALTDPDPAVQVQGARALRLFHTQAAIQALLTTSAKPGDLGLEATVSLAKLEPNSDPVHQAVLRVAAAMPKASPSERIAGARLLGLLGGSAESELAKLLKDPDPRVRRSAAYAYRKSEPLKTADALIHCVQTDPDIEVRRTACETIAERSLASCIPALRSVAFGKDLRLSRIAVNALARIGHPDCISALVPLSKGTDPQVARVAAIGQMNISIGRAEIYFPLIDKLFADTESPSGEARTAAARHLSFLVGPRSVASLRQLTLDENATVRVAAMEALNVQLGRRRASSTILIHPLPSWEDY